MFPGFTFFCFILSLIFDKILHNRAQFLGPAIFFPCYLAHLRGIVVHIVDKPDNQVAAFTGMLYGSVRYFFKNIGIIWVKLLFHWV